jgi:hypothetical protein
MMPRETTPTNPSGSVIRTCDFDEQALPWMTDHEPDLTGRATTLSEGRLDRSGR